MSLRNREMFSRILARVLRPGGDRSNANRRAAPLRARLDPLRREPPEDRQLLPVLPAPSTLSTPPVLRSTTHLSSSANPSVYGQPVYFPALVTAGPATGTTGDGSQANSAVTG